jgi:GNAT superfamily N-acetyltransferase
MKIRKMTHEELCEWHSMMLNAIRDGRVAMTIVCLFGGDRLSCCDEAMCVEVDGQIVSLASIAPEDEMREGQPTIVGLYTIASHRRKGYGLAAMKAAIERMVERGLMPIRVDVLSTGAARTLAKLPAELRQHLKVNEMGTLMDLF